MSPQQVATQLRNLVQRQQALLVDCIHVAELISLSTPVPQAAPQLANLATCAANMQDTWAGLDAACDTYDAIQDALSPAQRLMQAPDQRAFQAALGDVVQLASTCIICCRSGDELYARGIGWAKNGLCMACAKDTPLPELNTH